MPTPGVAKNGGVFGTGSQGWVYDALWGTRWLVDEIFPLSRL